MNVVCNEKVCFGSGLLRLICYKGGLLWICPVTNVVCFEWSAMLQAGFACNNFTVQKTNLLKYPNTWNS